MRQKIIKLVTTNDRGLLIGEGHHRAKLTDHEVDLIRELHEVHGVGYRVLARKFEVSRATIQSICNYRRRAQIAVGYKRVELAVDGGGMRDLAMDVED